MSSHPIITAGEPLLRCQNTLGEGPVWDSSKQLLHWVDIEKGEIHTYDPEKKSHSFVDYPGKRIGSLALRKDHPGFLAGVEKTLVFVDPLGPTPSLLTNAVLDPIPDQALKTTVDRFNDGVCDRKGRFVTGTMGEGAQLYSISPSTFLSTPLVSPVSCSNGTGWSPDDKTLYYVDSGKNAPVWAFDYDLETGGVSNRRVFVEDTFGDGGTFDGLTMDEEGCVWVARWRSSRIVKYLPDGTIGLEIRFPKAQNITCCIFGGKDLNDLYITTASCLASDQPELVSQFPEGGDLYRISIPGGVRGVDKFRFAG